VKIVVSWFFFLNQYCKKVLDVTHVKVFVLDEADNMLDQDGLGDQTLRVKKYASSSIRCDFFSSTPF